MTHIKPFGALRSSLYGALRVLFFRGRKKLFLRKDEMRKGWIIIICFLVVVTVSLLLLLLKPHDKISNIIQADAILALVIITVFYAKQMQELVKEERIALEDEKKKRYAEFGKIRLEQFYYPLDLNFTGLEIEFKKPQINLRNIEIHRKKVKEIYLNKIYMSSESMKASFDAFVLELMALKETAKTKLKEKINKDVLGELKKASRICMKETREIENNIKITFGYFVKTG